MNKAEKIRRSAYWYFSILIGIVTGLLIVLLAAGGILMGTQVRKSFLESWQNSLHLFSTQISREMEQAQTFVYTLPEDILYSDLGQSQGSSRYEFAKTNLARQIQHSEFLSSGFTDGLYIRIIHSGEIIAYRNAATVTSAEHARLLLAAATWENAQWHMEDLDGEEYLVRTIAHHRTVSSIVINKKSILAEWNAKNESIIPELGNSFADRKDYLLLTEALMPGTGPDVGIYIPAGVLADSMKWYYAIMTAAVILSALMVFVLTQILHQKIILPLKNMEETLERISNGSTEERMVQNQPVRELYSLAGTFNRMMEHIYMLRIETYELEIENERSRLINLEQQINPHLLLNSLNTVYALAEIGDLKTIQVFVMSLVKYFRYSLKNIEEPVLLRSELDFIKSYIEIQRIRYPNRFYVLYDVEEELMDYPVPPLMIQNFVENSIKYSLCDHEVEIVVGARRDEEKLRISIADNGKGIEPGILQRIQNGEPVNKEGERHIGIWNCRNRLRLFYGEDAQLTVTSEPDEGTCVWICIPPHGRGQDD